MCEQLAEEVFVRPKAGEAFTQMTVPAFLDAAGYEKPARSRSSSGKQNGQMSSSDKAAEAIRIAAEVAKRYAYSELDQLARQRIADADWTWVHSPEDRANIFTAYEEYARDRTYADIHWSLSAVVTELRFTVQHFSQQKLWPTWLAHPKDKELKNMPDSDDAYDDPGNETWEMIVNLMGFSSVVESLGHKRVFNAAPHATYGDRTNRSGVGNYNFRGNAVERLMVMLQTGMESEGDEEAAKVPRREARGK